MCLTTDMVDNTGEIVLRISPQEIGLHSSLLDIQVTSLSPGIFNSDIAITYHLWDNNFQDLLETKTIFITDSTKHFDYIPSSYK